MPRLSPHRTGVGLAVCVAAGLLAAGATPAAVGTAGLNEATRSARSSSAEGGFAREEARVRASLVFEQAHAVPGETIAAGVLIETDPGWHVYWRNPGEIGLPTQLRWSFPGAAATATTPDVGATQWPPPHVFYDADLEMTSYGYEGRVLLEVPLAIPPGASGPIDVALDLDFVVCEFECIPGEIALGGHLDVAAQTPSASAHAALFASARAERPRSAQSLDLRVDVMRPAGDPTLAAIAIEPCASAAPGCRALTLPSDPEALASLFLPLDAPDASGFEIAVLASRPHPTQANGFIVELRLEPARMPAGSEPAREVRGLIPLATAGGERVYAEIAFPTAIGTAATTTATDGAAALSGAEGPASAAVPSTASFADLARMLLFALLGGLVLNLMPCVLPVLAIKVVALAEISQGNRREALAHGAAYTAGVVGSLLALGGAVVALRTAGVSVGWGFQFQEPTFLAVLSIVLVAFALNLFGVYEITYQGGRLADLGHDAAGWRRSLFEGLLAVLLATPCSAPFLGTAVGFAFAASAPQTLAVFATIGLGLALPFAAISLVPSLSRMLPKPGTWMLHLRVGLGFAVLASAVWILDIASNVLAGSTLVMLVGGLVGVGFIAWLLGALQRSGRPRLALNAGIAALTGCMFGLVAVPLETRVDGPAVVADDSGSLPFARSTLARSLEQGSPTFVYFTAEWCLTCKVNEEMVLENDRVQAAFDTLGYQILRADWTRRDEAIRAELARFGRAGVPLYLVYSPEHPGEPQILPELLRVESTLAALERAAAR